MKKLLTIFIMISLMSLVWAANPNDVIINEFRTTHTTALTYTSVTPNLTIQGTWVELLTTVSGVDLRGWRLTDIDTKNGTGGADEGDIFFSNNANFASLPIGTYILIIAEENASNTANFPADDDDPTDKKMILYVGNSNLTLSNGTFNLSHNNDNIVLLDNFGNGVDFVSEGDAGFPVVTPATFGVSLNFETANFVGINHTNGARFYNAQTPPWFNNDIVVLDNNPTWKVNEGQVTNLTPGAVNKGQDDSSLPVSLSSFIALAGDHTVKLRWVTESEVQNVGFEILRRDGENGNFLKIGFVEGQFSTHSRTEYEFEDADVENGVTYYYQLVDVDVYGNRTYHDIVNATPAAYLAAKSVLLHPNFPNPFNPTTTLSFEVAPDQLNSKVVLEIYNVIGQKVKTLFNGNVEPGIYTYEWNGTDDNGRLMPGGIYYAVMNAGGEQQVQKMIFIK
ncbi:MAG: hypothetical protein Kow0037_12860 [Calditrichia bacterium]